MVRYDTAYIGRIYLFELTGEFVCMAQNASITGISREELAFAMKKEQKKVAAEKAELKKKGRKINQNDLIEKIFVRREREIAEKYANVAARPSAATTTRPATLPEPPTHWPPVTRPNRRKQQDRNGQQTQVRKWSQPWPDS